MRTGPPVISVTRVEPHRPVLVEWLNQLHSTPLVSNHGFDRCRLCRLRGCLPLGCHDGYDTAPKASSAPAELAQRTDIHHSRTGLASFLVHVPSGV